MKCLHLYVILILLILVIYYYNKSAVYEKVEHFDDNIINQLASIMNGDTVKLKNIELTGTLTAPNISATTITAPTITTRALKSTKANGDYINFDTNIFSPNNNLLGTISSGNEASKRTKIYFNNDVEFNNNINFKNKVDFNNDTTFNKDVVFNGNSNFNNNVVVKNDKALTAQNINTYNITSTNGVDSWVDVKSNINLYKTLKYQGRFITGKTEVMAGKKNYLSW